MSIPSYRQQLALDQMLASMRERTRVLRALQEQLFLYARLEEHTEHQFDALADLFAQQLSLLNQVHEGEQVSAEWLARRDALMSQMSAFIPFSEV